MKKILSTYRGNFKGRLAQLFSDANNSEEVFELVKEYIIKYTPETIENFKKLLNEIEKNI